jgi:hypothetical protein
VVDGVDGIDIRYAALKSVPAEVVEIVDHDREVGRKDARPATGDSAAAHICGPA